MILLAKDIEKINKEISKNLFYKFAFTCFFTKIYLC